MLRGCREVLEAMVRKGGGYKDTAGEDLRVASHQHFQICNEFFAVGRILDGDPTFEGCCIAC